MKRIVCGAVLILLAMGASVYGQVLDVLEPAYIGVKQKWEERIPAGETTLELLPENSTDTAAATGAVSWQVELAEPGLYNLRLHYLVRDDGILAPEIGIKINGSFPFGEARRIILPNQWLYCSSEPSFDRYNYELTPRSEKLAGWQAEYFYDAAYLFNDPLLFKLQAGLNTIEMEVLSGQIAVGKLEAEPPTAPLSYAEYDVRQKNTPHRDPFLLKIEAERTYTRSDSAIRARSERDPAVTPYDSKIHYLNVLDGASYSKGGQEVSWKFSVPERGRYRVAFKYKQGAKYDFPVFRRLLLNGEIPFEEFGNLSFPYSAEWTYRQLEVQGEPISLYLEEGEHILSMRVNQEHIRPVVEGITSVMAEINNLALQIQRLSGNRVDRFRDWNLEDYIPNVAEDLLKWAAALEGHYYYLNSFNSEVEEIGELVNLKIAFNQLIKLAAEPNEIPNRLDQLSTGSGAAAQLLGSLLQSLADSPLDLDAIFIYRGQPLPPAQVSWPVKLKESAHRFSLSFRRQSTAGNQSTERLRVWVNRARPYVQLLQQMIDESFTPQTGIAVELSLMPDEGKLILARASGLAPDVALGVSNWLPHELALRGALQDLRQFTGFAQAAQSFSPGVLIPFAYEEGLYALPETQDFWVLFYRTDIMQALNLPVPETWDDVLDILPELQRFGLNFSAPLATFGGFKPFAGTTPFLYQWGAELYSENGTAAAVDSEQALEAMRFMTELFTIYNLPQEVPNFYNHFRYGTLPIGISSFAVYIQLRTAAPEIADLWALAPYPARILNGEKVRWAPGSGQAAVILDQAEHPERAWRFLEWWLSAAVQTEYAYRLQTAYGETYLWNTANLEAFQQLPWPPHHKQVILEQHAWAREPSKVPGGYMLERELSNIWNKIVFDGENTRTAVDDAVIRINREISRKLGEFGFTEFYLVPTRENIEGWLRDRE